MQWPDRSWSLGKTRGNRGEVTAVALTSEPPAVFSSSSPAALRLPGRSTLA